MTKLLLQNYQIELELVATLISLGKYAKIHSIKATPKKQLLIDLSYRCTSFLVNKKVLIAQVDGNRIKKGMEHYS